MEYSVELGLGLAFMASPSWVCRVSGYTLPGDWVQLGTGSRRYWLWVFRIESRG